MQFNPQALSEKTKHFDEIKQHRAVLKNVIARNLGDDFEIAENQPIWRGGGATTYIVRTAQMKVFLKVKNRSVCVESKLEEEPAFIDEPSVEHEAKMLEAARNAGVGVPETVFFDSEGDFQFLATSYIGSALLEYLEKTTVEETLNIWDELIQYVRRLFDAGIIHSDLHEHNMRVDNGHLVLIDFEEARFLRQNCEFEQSLDYRGSNGISSLGTFPFADKQDFSVKTNSLLRMRQVFKKFLAPKTAAYVRECNYDSSNGICAALDHGKSELTYQSIRNDFFSVKGQRGMEDCRPDLLEAVLRILSANRNWTFVDIGSNNGLFCREISKRFGGQIRTIGLEGFHGFNVLAKALAFLEDCRNSSYVDFLCGDDDLQALGIGGDCFMTICSVWHHIQNKEAFLDQLRELNPRFIFFEMPIQKECYDGRTWEKEIAVIKEKLGFSGECFLANSNDYKRPLILLSRGAFPELLRRKLEAAARRIFFPTFLNKITKRLCQLWHREGRTPGSR